MRRWESIPVLVGGVCITPFSRYCLPRILGSSSRIRGVFFVPQTAHLCEQNTPSIMKFGALVVILHGMLLLPYWHRFLPLFQRISDNLCRIHFAGPSHTMLIHNSTLITLVHSMFQWASVWVLCGALMHSGCPVSLSIPHRSFGVQAGWKGAFKGFPMNPAPK